MLDPRGNKFLSGYGCFEDDRGIELEDAATAGEVLWSQDPETVFTGGHTWILGVVVFRHALQCRATTDDLVLCHVIIFCEEKSN